MLLISSIIPISSSISSFWGDSREYFIDFFFLFFFCHLRWKPYKIIYPASWRTYISYFVYWDFCWIFRSRGFFNFILFFIYFSHSLFLYGEKLERRLSSFPNRNLPSFIAQYNCWLSPKRSPGCTKPDPDWEVSRSHPNCILIISLCAWRIFIFVQLKNWTGLKSYWSSSAKEILL